MHRRPAASATSSKVAASRERRARRVDKINSGGGIRNTNGHLPLHSKQPKNGAGVGKCILFGLILFLVLLINHFATNSASIADGKIDGRWNFGQVLHPKNALKRIRIGSSKYHSAHNAIAADATSQIAGASNLSPYTVEALNKNPHLGWQPPNLPSSLGSSFSWRDCFKADAKSDGTGQPGVWLQSITSFSTNIWCLMSSFTLFNSYSWLQRESF